MKYAFTIYGDESQRESATPEELQAITQAYHALSQDMEQKGVLVAGEGLYPTQTATTVRVREGERDVTDGPFAETKEQLGGFYLIEAKDLNEAIQVASRIPSIRTGSIEVRPVVDFSKS